MKTSLDPRHVRRIKLMQSLFTHTFPNATIDDDASEILPKLEYLDSEIAQAAPDWPIDKIAHIDLAILRLACYELFVEKKEPPKVIIDEAVELAKQFGNEHSSQFINGVLGTLLKKT